MARYEHLPIYKTAMELAVYLQNQVRNFSRYNKYSIGSDLRCGSQEILKLIISVNSLQDKKGYLRELVRQCEMVKTLLIFAKEIKAFSSFKAFKHASWLAVNLCKQSEGWLKSIDKQGRNYPPSSK